MKILQVTNFFKPSWEAGGPARVCYDISTELVDMGHDITIYTTDGFKSKLNVKTNEPVDVDGIKTYYFRNLSRYLARNLVLPIPYYLPIIARKELNEFDVTHIHEYRTVSAIIIRYFATKYNVPYVLQAHGTSPKIVKRFKLKLIFDKLFGYKILKDASKLFALNETEVSQYIDLGADANKIVIIPNGIDSSKFDKLPEKGYFKKKYSIDSEYIILYVGRLHKSKGIDLLLESFAMMANKDDSIKLVLVGPDDGYQVEFEQMAKDLRISEKVIFTGFVEYEDKIAAYVDSDIFVTPWFSGFPVTFLEACACGLPIITTKKGDKLDWIHDKIGYVVEYNKEQLQDALFEILRDDRLRQKFGEEGKRLVRDDFEWGKIMKQIERIYENVRVRGEFK